MQAQIDELRQLLASRAPGITAVPQPVIRVTQWRTVATGINGMTVNVEERIQVYEKTVFERMTQEDPDDKNRTQFEKLGLSYQVLAD